MGCDIPLPLRMKLSLRLRSRLTFIVGGRRYFLFFKKGGLNQTPFFHLMKLIPYTYSSVKRGDKVIHTVRVLMEGNQVWTEGDLSNPVQEALELNGLFVHRTFQEGTYHYFQVDPEMTDLNSMYDYKECDPETDMLCWNTLLVITQGGLWIDIPTTHSFIKPILKAQYVDV